MERVDKDEVRKSRKLGEVEVSEAFSEGVEGEVREGLSDGYPLVDVSLRIKFP